MKLIPFKIFFFFDKLSVVHAVTLFAFHYTPNSINPLTRYLDFPAKTVYAFLSFPLFVTCLTHPFLFYFVILRIFNEPIPVADGAEVKVCD